MKLSHIAIAAIVVGVTACVAAEQKKDEPPKLEPWAHTYYWEEFTLSKDRPESADGRFQLKSVAKNGEVEVFHFPTAGQRELIVVKPMPKEFKPGARLPTVVLKASDPAKQVATIRELRIK